MTNTIWVPAGDVVSLVFICMIGTVALVLWWLDSDTKEAQRKRRDRREAERFRRDPRVGDKAGLFVYTDMAAHRDVWFVGEVTRVGKNLVDLRVPRGGPMGVTEKIERRPLADLCYFPPDTPLGLYSEESESGR